MNMNPANIACTRIKLLPNVYWNDFFITNVVYKGITIGNEEWSIYYCISLMSEANCNKNVFAPIFNVYILSTLAKRHPHLPFMCFYIYFIISRHAIIRLNCRYVQQNFFLAISMILQTKISIQSLKSVIWKENILDLYIWHLCNSLQRDVCHGNRKQIYFLS